MGVLRLWEYGGVEAMGIRDYPDKESGSIAYPDAYDTLLSFGEATLPLCAYPVQFKWGKPSLNSRCIIRIITPIGF